MSEREKFLIVKSCIDQMDYYGLLSRGAPKDEFDLESKEICANISYNHSIEEIADIIASVFNYYFDEHHSATVFTSVAEQIKNKLPATIK